MLQLRQILTEVKTFPNVEFDIADVFFPLFEVIRKVLFAFWSTSLE